MGIPNASDVPSPTEFAIPPGFKFACLGVVTDISPILSLPFSLARGIYVLGKVPFQLEEFWVQEIGKGQAKRFYESNLLILVLSDDQGTLEGFLRRVVITHYYALLIKGMAFSGSGLLLSGYSSLKGDVYETYLMPLDNFYGPHNIIPQQVDEEALRGSVEVAGHLRIIFGDDDGPRYLRLRKGFNAILKGIMEDETHTRLPQMVRSIEAIVRPSLSRIREDFIGRCQAFAGRSENTAAILNEIFDLRLFADHIYPMREAIGRYPDFEQDRIIATRTYQAEQLAGHILRQALTNKAMLEFLRTEDGLTELWNAVEADGYDVLGPTIDLEKVTNGRLLD
jgi:hypothetical protein